MSIIGRDFFTEASANTALNLHTPNDGGLWTLEAPQFQVIFSTGRVQHNRNAIDRARKADDIGSDQMDVSLDISVNASTQRLMGVCARMSTDGFANQFEAYVQFLNATTQRVHLYKNLGGVRTPIGNSPQDVTLAQNVQATLKLAVRAGTQVVTINGATVVSAAEPDSTLSGRRYAGILANGNNSGNATGDNFVSESVSTAGAELAGTTGASVTLSGVLSTAILLVGLLTGTATVTGANLTTGQVQGTTAGARDPLLSPNRAPGQSPGYPGLSRFRSMRPRLETFVLPDPPFAGASIATAAAEGTLTTGIPLIGAASATATLAGDLTAGPPLFGATQATAAVAGALTTQIQLVGTSAPTVSLTGELWTQTPIVLAGSATASATATATFYVVPSSLTVLPPDRQATWRPVWFLICPQLPKVFGTRDIDVPCSVPGIPMQQAWARIIGFPEITRRITDPFSGQVEVQDVTWVISDPDGELLGDYRAAPCEWRTYDVASGVETLVWTGLIFHHARDRDRVTFTGKNVDLAMLLDTIPVGTVTPTEFPLATGDAQGKTPPWVMGNVANLPLLNVRDDQVRSEFDYLLGRGTLPGLRGLRRVTPNGTADTVEMTYAELEPYPGMAGVLVNGGLEDWDAGPAVAPDGWTLSGAGATVAKNLTAAQVSEGRASASLTRVGADCSITQRLDSVALAAAGIPISWWQGREITVVVDVFATVAARGRIRVDDNVTTFDSAFHTGGGTYEPLTVGTVAVPCVISAAATRVRVECRVDDGNTTVHFDNVRVYVRAKSFLECLRPDLYAGYTAIRTFLRQEDPSGSLYTLAADVNGLQPERNPIRALRTWLTDATHGLGKTADATSFDTQEAALCLTHEDAARLDGPELFVPFRDTMDSENAASMVVQDRSGHERHGLFYKGLSGTLNFGATAPAPSGGVALDFTDDGWIASGPGDESYAEWPSDSAYSGQDISMRACVQIFTLPDATAYPICEKLVGANGLSGYGFYREANALVFFVRGSDTNLYSVTSPLVDVVDEDRWIDAVGVASGGMLTLYRDGVLAATGTYTAPIAEGEGVVRALKSGVGFAQMGVGGIDNLTIIRSALSAPRVAALYAALSLDFPPVIEDYANTLPAATFNYTCTQDLGDVNMVDATGAHSGAWVGGPTLGVPGPLNPERGPNNSGTAVRFVNNVAQYGVETGMTLADAQGTIAVWYKPAAMGVAAGIVEKTIAGVRDTQWGLCQRPSPTIPAGVIRFTLVTTAGAFTLDLPLTPEDIGRWGFYVATWRDSTGELRFFKNGVEGVTTGTYTGTAVSGVGDFYVGCQGTNGGPLTRPAQGDIGRVSYHPSFLSSADRKALWHAATWYNGGLCVDAALTEPRQAGAWLAQLGLYRSIRLGTTLDGTLTVSADLSAPTTIRMHARDGRGDGERTIMKIHKRQRPRLDETVRDVVVEGRIDLLSGAPLVTRRRAVSTRVDAQGQRIGRDRVVRLDIARALPTLDRVAAYLAALLKLDETVAVTLPPVARRLLESELVQVTDGFIGYADAVLRASGVALALPQVGAELREYDETPYTWTPDSYPVDSEE